MTGELNMDLPKFIALVRARIRLVGAIVAAAVLLALVASLLQPSRYEATADLLFGPTTAADVIVAGGITDTGRVPERVAATNLALASLDAVAARVKQRLRDPASVQQLKDAVTIETQGESDVGTVTAESSTPARAAALANAFATEIVALRRETAQADIQLAIDALQAAAGPTPTPEATPAPESDATRTARERVAQLQVLKALESGGVRIVERATPLEHRSSPKPLRNAVIAGFVALVLALFIVLLLARFEERITDDEEEVAALMEAPVLARIPVGSRFRRLTAARTRHHDRAFIESFEFLRFNLQLTQPAGGRLVLAVTSPTAADGKTTVVGWLARSLALSGAEVVAVDLDVRKPELHTYLSAPSEAGNGDVRARHTSGSQEPRGEWGDENPATSRGREDDSAALDLTQATLYPRLRLLSGAEHLALLTELMGRRRLPELFESLRAHADYVLIDTVPVSTVADASAVAAAADGVILVVDFERTRRKDLLAAKNQLVNTRASVVGVVLNRASVDHRTYHALEESPDLGREPSAGA